MTNTKCVGFRWQSRMTSLVISLRMAAEDCVNTLCIALWDTLAVSRFALGKVFLISYFSCLREEPTLIDRVNPKFYLCEPISLNAGRYDLVSAGLNSLVSEIR